MLLYFEVSRPSHTYIFFQALPAGVGEDGVWPELGEVGVEDGEPELRN